MRRLMTRLVARVSRRRRVGLRDAQDASGWPDGPPCRCLSAGEGRRGARVPRRAHGAPGRSPRSNAAETTQRKGREAAGANHGDVRPPKDGREAGVGVASGTGAPPPEDPGRSGRTAAARAGTCCRAGVTEAASQAGSGPPSEAGALALVGQRTEAAGPDADWDRDIDPRRSRPAPGGVRLTWTDSRD